MMLFRGLSSKIFHKPSVFLDLFSSSFLIAMRFATVSPAEVLWAWFRWGSLKPSILADVGCLRSFRLDPTILFKVVSCFILTTLSVMSSVLKYTVKTLMAWASCQDQVSPTALTFLIFPTTSYASISKGHTNAQVLRVYKYPTRVTDTNQVRNGLTLGSRSQNKSFKLVLPHSTSRKFCYFSSVADLQSFDNTINNLWFFPGVMASSPRSVLDAMFQCEAAPIVLEDSPSSTLVQALDHTLAGRLLTSKRPSVANLTLAASRLWNCTHRLSCFDHGKCLYSFEFTFAPDVEKVVSGGPWYINGDMLLISRMNPNQSIEQLPFAYTKLWVRCYDLPPKCFIKKYAVAIGNSLGRFCETDLPPEDPDEAKLLVRKLPTVRKYMRVNFEFNLYGPLKSIQNIKISNANGVVVEEHISRLTYERLPHTCFRCGFLGHLVEGCSFKGPLLYGEWIRAEKFFRINLQSNPIQKNIPPIYEGQCSTSQRAENRVTNVSNMEELVNTIVNDPAIIRADFSLNRTVGSLPASKGKAPLLSPTLDINPIPPQSSSLIPYNNASPPKSVSPRTVYGPPADSIMGPAPMFMHLQGSPLGSDPILIDTDEGQFASYLNSITSVEDPGASNPSRCLFKCDPNYPNQPSSIKELNPPVKDSGPATLVVAPLDLGGSSRILSNVFKEEIRKLPAGRKHAPSNPQTPRPKRGRQASTLDAC